MARCRTYSLQNTIGYFHVATAHHTTQERSISEAVTTTKCTTIDPSHHRSNSAAIAIATAMLATIDPSQQYYIGAAIATTKCTTIGPSHQRPNSMAIDAPEQCSINAAIAIAAVRRVVQWMGRTGAVGLRE